jgi:hypothetical protein
MPSPGSRATSGRGSIFFCSQQAGADFARTGLLVEAALPRASHLKCFTTFVA